MLGNSKVNNIFLKRNKLDLLRIKKRGYLFTGLSSIKSISELHSICYSGFGLSPYTRSSFKFSCSLSGKYGFTVGKLPLNRFVLLKYMLFSKLSFLSKKS